jgi:hypothetical protein
MPETVLGIRDTAVNKTKPHPHGSNMLVGVPSNSRKMKMRM